MRQTGKFIIDAAAPALCICAIAYFAYGAIAGASGYKTLSALREEAREKSARLEGLVETREALEAHADRLNPKALDPDMVDERVRAILGFTHENDYVLPREELERLLRAEENPRKR